MKDNPYTPPLVKNLEVIDDTREIATTGYLNIVIGWVTSLFSVILWVGGCYLIIKISHKADIFNSFKEMSLWLFLCLVLQFPGVLFLWFSTKYINSIWASSESFRKPLKVYCWVTGGGAIIVLLFMALWVLVGKYV